MGLLLEGCDLNANNTNSNILSIKRPVYTQHEFDTKHGGRYIKKSWKRKFLSKVRSLKREYCEEDGIKNCVKDKFPFFSILMKYKWKEWIVADLIAGLIVGIMHIPQSMLIETLKTFL